MIEDSAYSLNPWLMKLLTGARHAWKELFSCKLSRMAVKCLEAHWRYLRTHMDATESNIPQFVVSVCMFRNIFETKPKLLPLLLEMEWPLVLLMPFQQILKQMPVNWYFVFPTWLLATSQTLD
ncbi:hypothetical protein Y1Q_0003112 [Alligator mississippiensis]|uniref:Uncharacterized protein n=1 Tax=Alligator mississippiensis TaxID=8496 RepID=A0A151MDL1_ALLMI|nr:hypothetical protein Y1Q_0003112 [Alligator mississippiensis]